MTSPKPRPGILSIAPYVPGRNSIDGMETAIKLASNEGALGPSPRAMTAFATMSSRLHRYPDGDAHDLRHAIGRRHGLPPEQIVCSAGSDELVTLLCRAFAGPDDEVLFTEFGFVMYPIATRAVGATPVAAKERAYTADVNALLASVTPRTRIVFLANPNNPTGTYAPQDEIRRLRAGLRADILLVIDAAYAEYITRNDYAPGIDLVAAHDNVVMMRTFSKIYGLAALRVGWAYAPPAIVDVLHRIRNPFNVNAVAQAAAIAAVDDVEFVARGRAHNDQWLPWLAREIAALGLDVVPSAANFVLVGFPATGKTAAAANSAVNAGGVIIRPVTPYGLPHHLRATVGMESENRALVAALAAFLKA